MRLWIKALNVIVLLTLITCTLSSQVPVEISKDKVIISGIPYYIHQVKKGETSYSISKAYNISVEELIKENPPAVLWHKRGTIIKNSC